MLTSRLCGRKTRNPTQIEFETKSPATTTFQPHGVRADARPAANKSLDASTASLLGVKRLSLSSTGSGVISDMRHQASREDPVAPIRIADVRL